MKKTISIFLLGLTVLMGGCADDKPPPSVDEFLDNRILLDAVMVRCTRNRSETKYEKECINARDAANKIEREEEAERRAALEKQSESKRAALRRTQEAAEEARRRAAEAERLRKEAEYLMQFGGEATSSDEAAASERTPPGVSFEQPESGAADDVGDVTVDPSNDVTAGAGTGTVVGATPADSGSEAGAPAADAAPSVDDPQQDLQSVREELRRRQQ